MLVFKQGSLKLKELPQAPDIFLSGNMGYIEPELSFEEERKEGGSVGMSSEATVSMCF